MGRNSRGELAPNATVMSWRGTEGGIYAAKMGHDAIMTPTTYCYLDYCQASDPENEPLNIGGYRCRREALLLRAGARLAGQ